MTSTDRGEWASKVLAVAADHGPERNHDRVPNEVVLGTPEDPGSFKAVEGTARVTETGVEGTLVIDASSIDTGNKKLNQHLRFPDWFELELHPTFVFILRGAMPMGDATVRLDGSFIVCGRSRLLEILATVVEAQADTIELKSDFQIDRRDWDISVTKMGAKTLTEIDVNARWRRAEL